MFVQGVPDPTLTRRLAACCTHLDLGACRRHRWQLPCLAALLVEGQARGIGSGRCVLHPELCSPSTAALQGARTFPHFPARQSIAQRLQRAVVLRLQSAVTIIASGSFADGGPFTSALQPLSRPVPQRRHSMAAASETSMASIRRMEDAQTNLDRLESELHAREESIAGLRSNITQARWCMHCIVVPSAWHCIVQLGRARCCCACAPATPFCSTGHLKACTAHFCTPLLSPLHSLCCHR